MFKDKATLALLATANQQIDADKIELDAFKAAEPAHLEAAAQLVTVQAELEALTASSALITAELEKVKGELETSEASQADFKEKVANAVRAEVSAKGSAPAPEALDVQEARAELKAEYEAIAYGDPKKKEFRNKHPHLFK